MRRAIVHDPKQQFTSPIGFLRQSLLEQPAKGCNTGRQFTLAHNVPPADVPGGHILPGPPRSYSFSIWLLGAAREGERDGYGGGPGCWSSRRR